MLDGAVGNVVCHNDIPPDGVIIETKAIVLKTALAILPPPSVVTAVLPFALALALSLLLGVLGGVCPGFAWPDACLKTQFSNLQFPALNALQLGECQALHSFPLVHVPFR